MFLREKTVFLIKKWVKVGDYLPKWKVIYKFAHTTMLES